NVELLQVFERLARQSLKELSTKKNYSDKVIQILSHRISNLPDVAETKKKLGVSSRNLQQKLQLEETTFNDLRTLTRTRFARNYLLSSSYPAYEVGYLLGYSDPSVFYRAFKQWTGQTPNEFRSLNAIPAESSG
ncbi:MAG: helix-turn-helix transcriptional regulator, partial [Planctomycetota bacterium]